MGAQLLVETLDHIDEIKPAEQDHRCGHRRPTASQGGRGTRVEVGAHEIDRRVRALQPWPGVTLPTKKGRVKVLSGHVEGDRYVPDVVQLPGKRPAPAKQVLGDA